jgi:hypothetical protein
LRRSGGIAIILGIGWSWSPLLGGYWSGLPPELRVIRRLLWAYWMVDCFCFFVNNNKMDGCL